MISVVIPAFNEALALPRTLENVFRQDGVYEVIVVDDGSADATRDNARAGPGGACSPRRKGAPRK